MRWALALIIVLAAIGCGTGPRLERHETHTITAPQHFRLGNFAVVHVVPDVRDVYVDWRGYDTRSGDAFRPPFETLRLAADHEEYVVTNRGVGNNALEVNGRTYEFDASEEQVVIRFGSGVSIEPGGGYSAAAHIHDWGDAASDVDVDAANAGAKDADPR